jgi:dienelactone hydrolase
VRIGRDLVRISLGVGLVVLGLAVLGNALSPSWEPRRLPANFAYGALPPMPEPTTSEGSATRGSLREDVRIQVSDEVLGGTVVSPAEAGRYPAVVLVHGAGLGRRSDLIELAELFARAGIVALAYDKRTVGYSAATNRDFDLLANDALAAVRLLRQRDDVNPARVGLWGISEGGGWVVPIAASRAPEEVAFAVLVSGPMVSPIEQLTWWVETGLARLGAPKGLREAAAKALGMGGFDYVHHDPLPAMERVSQPVLAIYGTQDRSVPVVQSSRQLEAALERGGNRSYAIRFFAGADHGLRVDDGRFAPGYLPTMVAWFEGLPATAEPPHDARIAGATPAQRYAADAPPAPPLYATATALAIGFGLAAVGFLAGPIAALVVRRRRGGSDNLSYDVEAWRGIRRLLRWLAVSGISTHLLFNLVLAASIALALAQVGSPIVASGGWLVVRLGALATVALAVASADAAASAARAGWRPTGAQAASLAGSFSATGILILIAAYWGLFAFRW